MLRKKDAEKNENEKETHILFYKKLKKRNKKKKKLKQSLCCSFKLYNLRRNCYFDNFPKKLLICRKCVFAYFEVNVVANIIFMRHGARTPKKKIKNIWPFVEKKGDLTFLGFEQSIKIGEYLREYYHSLKKLNKKYNKKRYRHIRDSKVFKFFKWNEEHQIKEMLNYFICVKKGLNSTDRPLFMGDQTIENSLFLNYINYLYFHKKHLLKKKLKNYDIKKKKNYDTFIKVINKYLSIRTTNSERCKLTAYAIICGILGVNKKIYMSFFLLKYINNIDFFQDSWKIFKILNEEIFSNCIHSDIWNIWWNKNKKGLEKCLKNNNFFFSDNIEKRLKFDYKLCYYKEKCRYTKIIEKYDLFMNIISFINFYINVFFYFLKILYILCSIVKVAERDTIMISTLKSTNNYIKILKNYIFENSNIYKFLNNYYKSEISIIYYLTKWKSNYICRFSLLLNNKYSNYSNKGKDNRVGIIQNKKDNKIGIIQNKIFTILKKYNSTLYILKKKLNKSIILNDIKKINYSSGYMKNYLHLPILFNLKNMDMNIHKIKLLQINSIYDWCNKNDNMGLYNYKYHIFKRKQKNVKIIKQFVSSYDAYLYHNINIIFDIKKGHENLKLKEINFQNYFQKKQEKINKLFFQKIYQCYKWMMSFEYNNRYLSWVCSGLSLIDVVINFLISVRLFENKKNKKKYIYTPKVTLYLTHQSAILSFQSCIGIKKKYMKIPPFGGFISLELIQIKMKIVKNNSIILHSSFSNFDDKNNVLNFGYDNNFINIFCCKEDCVWKKKKNIYRKRRKGIQEIKKNTKLENYKNIFKVHDSKIHDFKKLFFLLCKENIDIDHLIQLYDECLKNNYKNIRNLNFKNDDNIKDNKKKRKFHGFFVKFTFNNFFPLKLEKKNIITKNVHKINDNHIMKDISNSNQNYIFNPKKFKYIENIQKNNYSNYNKLDQIIKIYHNDYINLENTYDKYMDYIYNSNSDIYRNIYTKLNKIYSEQNSIKKHTHFNNKIMSRKYNHKQKKNENILKPKSENKYSNQLNNFKFRHKFTKKKNVLIPINFEITQNQKFYIFQNKNVDLDDQNDGVTGYRIKGPRKKGALKIFKKWAKKKTYKNEKNTQSKQYMNGNIICLDCLVAYLKKMIRVYGNPEMV
ncbi:conserved Plasmodium protein, unknown function [Plasmodium berghei]|uniref:Uncharacterized protein n=2 Tax=Plasmodium berghei TaxID=5821 RepID=A0A509AEN1_PLABA|nr:conserved Plasmodium protein, unknown function [Plasmodium berghei ANKA]CXH93418.1 conserved Plasmodium protein, unknown function [Plasmodium berghei]SCL90791.1 conserved Plasmodium protein, unknown function [Plasmodium berghei]SCM15355.1 conserved Plasmodium protein, unknown function [Plasmodium berghei]SCM17148.1 conserved Plasmodium protein, unknown function [Plasmodium berghei]SCN22156.1 conserved Plasmodium protein, unknown function [Plasmodium berghei]|eukprot:XP_034419939.1 conserved Plasmodium protein, unknown function [Plasmodium berghei ANKA]